MNKYEFETFAKRQYDILRNSYIDVDFSCIEVQTKKNLYHIISKKLNALSVQFLTGYMILTLTFLM